MALSDEQIAQGQKYLKTWQQCTALPMVSHHLVFAQAIEAEVRKQDEVLIRHLMEALVDLVEAGEEAWGDKRPCVRIGKEEITAARARLGEVDG